MARFFVYNTTMADGLGAYKVVRWGSAPASEFSNKAYDSGDVVLANSTGYEFAVSPDPGVIYDNWYNPATTGFSVSAVSSGINSSSASEAVNFLTQDYSTDMTSDRILRLFGTEGSFGLGATLPTQITDFTVDTPAVGFYYFDEATVIGGPINEGHICSVVVTKGVSDKVLFHVCRLTPSLANYRQWIGARNSTSGAVTWMETSPMSDLTRAPNIWIKEQCKLCSDANIVLSTGGLLTVDGNTTAEGDRILLIGQTTPAENGIYTASSGAWVRTGDADSSGDISCAIVSVRRGTNYGGSQWATDFKINNIIGSTAMSWYRLMRSDTLSAMDLIVKSTAPASFSVATSLTAANLQTVAVQYTGAAANLTLPTATALNSGFPAATTDTGVEFSVVNTGSGAATLAVNTGVTIVGAAAVAAGASGRFCLRKSGASTWVCYRLS